MKLYVGRHGEAGLAPRDDDRRLTPKGESDCLGVYSQCRGMLTESDLKVVVSPLVRAQQTAAIAAAQLFFSSEQSITSRLLRPEGDIRALAQWLDQLDTSAVLLVGHQPLLGDFLAWLCDEPSMVYGVATASVHALEVSGFCRGGAALCWRRSPF